MATPPKLRKKMPTMPKKIKRTLLLRKQLVGVSISEILYHRKIFDESYFYTRLLHGVETKELKTNLEDAAVKKIVNMMFVAQDAIDKRHLRQMILVLKDEGCMREKHTFTFDSSNEDIVCELQYTYTSREYEKKVAISTIKDQDKHFQQCLKYFMNQLTYKFTKPSIAMKLTCFEEVTFPNYHPKLSPSKSGQNISRNSQEIFKQGLPSNLNMGLVNEVEVPFITSTPDRVGSSKLNMGRDNPMGLVNEVEVPFITSTPDRVGSKRSGIWPDEEVPSTSTAHERASSKHSELLPRPEIRLHPRYNDSTFRDVSPVRCPCKGSKVLPEMIRCHHCQTYQHMACFGLISFIHVPDVHTCVACAEKNPDFLCTRPLLLEVEPELRPDLCQFLKAIATCKDIQIVTVTLLSQQCEISVEQANMIINKMLNLEIIMQTPIGLEIKRNYYDYFVSEYFYNFHKKRKATIPTPSEIMDYNE